MREARIEAAFKREALNYGCVSLKLQGPAGWPDQLVICPGGATLFLEFKTSIGVLSPTQKHWLARLKQLGHRAEVARSVEEALEILTAFLTEANR